ncbi:MAG: LPS assembly lipoprotein LptE [Bdellovibrionales bacterium]
MGCADKKEVYDESSNERIESTNPGMNAMNYANLCGIIFLTIALGACGFQPLYATGGFGASIDDAVAQKLQQVAVESMPERSGQILRNNLIDLLYAKGRPAHPQYRLKVDLKTSEEYLGLLANSTSTLAELDSNATFFLTDAQGKELFRGTAHSATTYDRLNNQFVNLSAHDDAVERTLREIATQIANQVAMHLKRKP